ncbi:MULTISPECIES: hypothetical protein [Halomicrobium]|uniref:Uncharacterized protein n=2 Tax=Halomicrobium mukohataei TaxID=57705 RepID=C7NZI1_HALMD|nr:MULTISPECIES: hypothetical protein [Halomicrobium]ACV48749.1 conserved hypothetical protein [Halomicrobium mukohataei DSM 12286]QCD64178.1 hypothetical protein E5139_00500 [Halomicrobium mukohataei]QFR18984.1 hypothetical protein GBQ70_00500 [Halomicrobium sp. ZPS1]
MATRIQTDTTTRTDEQHATTDPASEGSYTRPSDRTPESTATESWTERCGAPRTFDPTNHAEMGQFDTTADQP